MGTILHTLALTQGAPFVLERFNFDNRERVVRAK
jgi:hypothetical protein